MLSFLGFAEVIETPQSPEAFAFPQRAPTAAQEVDELTRSPRIPLSADRQPPGIQESGKSTSPPAQNLRRLNVLLPPKCRV